MMDFCYLLEHFFTHKDFLAPPHQIPGTLFTPLHLIFAAILLAVVIGTSIYVGKRQALVRPVFIGLWIIGFRTSRFAKTGGTMRLAFPRYWGLCSS